MSEQRAPYHTTTTPHIQYIEVSLEKIIADFAKEFQMNDGRQILSIESFIDPFKKIVVFKLFVKPQEEK